MLGFLLKLIPGFSTLVYLSQFAVGVVYPTWQSFKAIESSCLKDDTQWLSYWVVYSTLQIVEKFAWPVLIWIPLYNLFKIAFLAWLALPQFHGATFVYSEFVRPLLLALAEKAKDIPQLEPFVRDFCGPGARAQRSVEKAAGSASGTLLGAKATAQHSSDDAVASLKTHGQ